MHHVLSITEWLAEIKGMPNNVLQQGFPDNLKLFLQWTDDNNNLCNTTLNLQQNYGVSSVVPIHGINQLTGQAAVLSTALLTVSPSELYDFHCIQMFQVTQVLGCLVFNILLNYSSD